jgi:hypothetical protein
MFTFCKYNCFPFHFVYLMQSFHHILQDMCKYLMIQSSIWQLVHTRTSEDPFLDIPKGPIGRGHGHMSHVVLTHLHRLTCLSAWINYWPLRLT